MFKRSTLPFQQLLWLFPVAVSMQAMNDAMRAMSATTTRPRQR